MNIQEMLGDAFHEGMTIDEINTALSGKKFADLSSGQYVDKNKYTADLEAANASLAKAKEDLNARLSDEEKAKASREADKAYIKKLEEQVRNQEISSNYDRASALTSDARSLLDIKDDDADYKNLLNVLSAGNSDTTRSTASYINKLVKDSYEKGKKDATKDSLGGFADGVGKQGSTKTPEIGSFGKELAKTSTQKVDSDFFFKRN